MERKVEWYGWSRDLPDARDKLFRPVPEVLEALPPAVDLRPQDAPIYDQGALGSCTANGIAGLIEFDQRKQGLKEFTPSRLMIYYNERVIENTVNSDSGAMIRDGIKSVASQGVCPESEWPYDITRFRDRPPDSAYADAIKYKALSYESIIQDLDHLRACLAAGYPVVFGFTVYESFESSEVANTGIVPMPGPSERVLGGHAAKIVGYDDSKRLTKVGNSWGDGWGDHGYFYMPYDYVLDPNLAGDFWTIRLVGSPDPAPTPGPTPPSPGPTPPGPYPGVQRVSMNRYAVDGYQKECVVKLHGVEVAHSTPLKEG